MFFKTNENAFICEECGITCKQLENLNRHIGIKHNKEEYYEKYVKEDSDGICQICNEKILSFNKLSFRNYAKTCSKKCQEKLHSLTLNSFSDDKINRINTKRTNTCKKLYGVNNIMQNKEIFTKQKNTMFKLYGVERATQHIEFMEKSLKKRRQKKQFRDTNIWYQGSYELDFLEKYYDKYPDIQRGPSIKYKYKGKNKVYHSDFLIPSKNIVIECKSTYTLQLDIEINEKRLAVINNRFNYIMILNKNYIDLENAK